jgi:hypothetical protein
LGTQFYGKIKIIFMTVSMDGLRLQLLYNYNSLTRKLNRGNIDGKVKVEADDIEHEMNVIRDCIVTLAFMYDDREGGFKELDNPKFETFNPMEED